MKTTILTNSNTDTKLTTRRITRNQFGTYAEFQTWCIEKNINGDIGMLWLSLNFLKEMNVFSPKEG